MGKGCGCSSGWLKWFKPPMAGYFYTACCVHDDDYDRGGTWVERKAADRRLFSNMLHTIQRQEGSPYKAMLYANVALLYFVSVRVFGSRFFNYWDKNKKQYDNTVLGKDGNR